MGASAAVNQIPSDLLLEEANKNYRHQLLTKESLATLRRSSYSTFANPRRVPATSEVQELPPHVLQLLKKTGIVSQNDEDNEAMNQLTYTTKLVSHIFECLGSLQHLVRANQALFPTAEDESQSVCELSTQGVGTLVHEMVTIYGLCGDTLRILLAANPEAARIEDSFGRLPLHAAIDSNKPWLGAIETLIEAYPEALTRRDGGGRLPLHIAVDRPAPDSGIVHLLVRLHKASAGARRGVGRLPIHYGMFCDILPLDILQCLHEAFPDGIRTVDVYGRLPLHYAVDKSNPILHIVKYLIQSYPEGVRIRDSHLRLPLSVAVDRDNPCMHVVRMLCSAHPASLTEPGMGNKLPVHIALETPIVSVPCVYYLLKQNPSTMFMAYSKSGRDTSPLALAKQRGNKELYRAVLGCIPNHEPTVLRDLNWAARRIAFLLLTDHSSSTEPSPISMDSPRRLSHLQIRIQSSSLPIHFSRTVEDILNPRSSQASPHAHSPTRQQNLFLKLYYANEELFRLAVLFL